MQWSRLIIPGLASRVPICASSVACGPLERQVASRSAVRVRGHAGAELLVVTLAFPEAEVLLTRVTQHPPFVQGEAWSSKSPEHAALFIRNGFDSAGY